MDMLVSPNGVLARNDGTFFTLAKMKHKRNISQVQTHANACYVGVFYSHPETTISMQVVFNY